MKVLIADDDRFSRSGMRKMLESCEYKVLEAGDGAEALRIFIAEKPDIVVTDWMMPKIDGVELVRKIRAFDETRYCYVVMVTAKNRKEDMLKSMDAGVDDFLSKPFHREELRVRLRAGERILSLHQALGERITELEEARKNIKTLQGFLPICAYCKKVRSDGDYWQKIEEYMSEASEDLVLSHSICPECYEKHVKKMEEKYYSNARAGMQKEQMPEPSG